MQSRLPFEHTTGCVPMCTCHTGFPLCRNGAVKQESIRVFMSLLLAAFLWLLCPCNLLTTTHAHSSPQHTHTAHCNTQGSSLTAMHTAPRSLQHTCPLAHGSAHGTHSAPHAAPGSHCTSLLALTTHGSGSHRHTHGSWFTTHRSPLMTLPAQQHWLMPSLAHGGLLPLFFVHR